MYKQLALAAFLALATGGPVPDPDPQLTLPIPISLPPLIPAIPGVTEPLASNAPPLPILQLPTPPLPSPPHEVNSNLRPKKIGYFWTGKV